MADNVVPGDGMVRMTCSTRPTLPTEARPGPSYDMRTRLYSSRPQIQPLEQEMATRAKRDALYAALLPKSSNEAIAAGDINVYVERVQENLASEVTQLCSQCLDGLFTDVRSRRLFVILEPELKCDPTTDHQRPKDILPLYRNRIEERISRLREALISAIGALGSTAFSLRDRATSLVNSVLVEAVNTSTTQALLLGTELEKGKAANEAMKGIYDLDRDELIKEILCLREQLYVRSGLGKHYEPDFGKKGKEDDVEELVQQRVEAIVSKLQSQMKEMNERMEAKLAALREKLCLTEKELNEARDTIKEKEKEITELVRRYEDQIAEMEARHEEEMNELKEAHAREVEALQNELERVKNELADALAREAVLVKQVAKLENLVAELRATLAKNQEKIKKLKAQVAVQEKLIASLEEENRHLSEVNDELRSQMNQIEEQKRQLEVEMAKMKEAQREAEEEKRRDKIHIADLEEQLREALGKVECLEGKIQEMQEASKQAGKQLNNVVISSKTTGATKALEAVDEISEEIQSARQGGNKILTVKISSASKGSDASSIFKPFKPTTTKLKNNMGIWERTLEMLEKLRRKVEAMEQERALNIERVLAAVKLLNDKSYVEMLSTRSVITRMPLCPNISDESPLRRQMLETRYTPPQTLSITFPTSRPATAGTNSHVNTESVRPSSSDPFMRRMMHSDIQLNNLPFNLSISRSGLGQTGRTTNTPRSYLGKTSLGGSVGMVGGYCDTGGVSMIGPKPNRRSITPGRNGDTVPVRLISTSERAEDVRHILREVEGAAPVETKNTFVIGSIMTPHPP